MATFGPPAPDADPVAAPAFATARLLILQRALATLTHELGNMTSPVALVADALTVGATPAQQASVAGTLRLVANSLRDSTAVCRILRGNLAPGALSPATFTDTSHWWSLCQPFVADMLPDMARVHANVAATTLDTARYDALTWSAVAAALLTATTRAPLTNLTVTGTADDARPHLAAEDARPAADAGGALQVVNTASRLDLRITIAPISG